MCVVALALNQHPDWPILLAGNRDELHARPSEPLHGWTDGSGIIAGRDTLGGGTWLGVQPARAALVVVTNVRCDAGPDPAKMSRGTLVRDQLTGIGAFADPALDAIDRFNGFSLLGILRGKAELMTNRPHPARAPLPPGVHSFANAPLGIPCPRADRLGAALRGWIAEEAQNSTPLLDILTAEDDPALFLNNPVYGTRCSTLVAIDRAGQGRITERRYGKGGIPLGETALDFRFAV